MVSGLVTFLSSSIVKKTFIALTGLALCVFLIGHLTGNLLLMVSSDAFNIYAYRLTSTSLIYVAEAGLLAVFLVHLGLAIKTSIENKRARGPVKYLNRKKTGRGGTFASSTMIITGPIILAFLIMHLLNFKFGTTYYTVVDGIEMRDLYRTVMEYFADPVHVGLYVVAMLALGIHLTHGVQSAFFTLGLHHPKYLVVTQKGGWIFAALITIGFSYLAVWCYLKGASL